MRQNDAGAAAIEFAMVCPLLLMILFGVLTYGWYFYTAHTIQEITGDIARAALPGLTASERLSLAQSQLAIELQGAQQIDPSKLTLAVSSTVTDVTVTINYSLAGNAFAGFAKFVPLPSQTVTSSSTIKLGGF